MECAAVVIEADVREIWRPSEFRSQWMSRLNPRSVEDRKSTRLNSSHRVLPSFPPRRSSDLDGICGCRNRSRRPRNLAAERVPQPVDEPFEPTVGRRSEEHTSELQSPSSPLFPSTTLFRSRWNLRLS